MRRRMFHILVLSFCIALFAGRAIPQLKTHPRVLFKQTGLDSIIQRIRWSSPRGVFADEFKTFVNDTSFINTNFTRAATTHQLWGFLNKIMKNSFLHAVGYSGRVGCGNPPGYACARNAYLSNIQQDLDWLSDPNTVRAIKNMGGLEGANYAIKALSIAYDWTFQILQDSQPGLKTRIEGALSNFGDWMIREKLYGTVFQNHGPWDSKAIAYIAASLGEPAAFDGPASEKQKNSLGHTAVLRKSAKGYLEQVFEGLDWACSPRGGWHEGASYFMVKELPELIEYAEVLCVYMDDAAAAAAIFSKPVFVFSGETLIQMTTPDGFFMKFSDTGNKSALSTEYDGSLGYGDINNIGAGYLAGYHMTRLYDRLKRTHPAPARMIKYYVDRYCFKPPFPTAREYKINRLYRFIWQNGEETAVTWDDIRNLPEMSTGRYYEKAGILISRQAGHDVARGTIVRFDTNPYYLNDHQHFGAGNFVIYKGTNLAIDGGRYTIDDNYRENTYRSSVSHNVLLFGDRQEIGQDRIPGRIGGTPINYSQRGDYADWAVGPDHVSINVHEPEDAFSGYDYKYRSVRLDLKNVYDEHAKPVDGYVRQLVHLFRGNHDPDCPDFILTHDFVRLAGDGRTAVTWQMHFKFDTTAYGAPVAQNPMRIVRKDCRMFVKCLSPSAQPAVVRPVKPVGGSDGRIHEESDFILRFISRTESPVRELVHVLFPTTTAFDSRSQFDADVVALDSCRNASAIEILDSDNIPNLDRNLVCCFVPPSTDSRVQQVQYHLSGSQTEARAAHYVFGLKNGRYRVHSRKKGGDWTVVDVRSTKKSAPDNGLGAVVFETHAGYGDAEGRYALRLVWEGPLD